MEHQDHPSIELTPRQRQTAIIGLILVAVAPSVSVTTGFAFKVGSMATVVFIFTKVWMFGLPVFWHLKVEGREISWSKPDRGGWGVSALLGIGMMLVIGITYFLLGEMMLQPEALKAILDPVGLTTAWKLAAAIVFWVFINSVLEEYVFRWFVTSKIEQLFGGKWRSILLSALVFTLHHTIALLFFIDLLGAILASIGVFIGGAVFSWIYLEYRSIWVAWLAHALADVAIFIIAWNVIIGF